MPKNSSNSSNPFALVIEVSIFEAHIIFGREFSKLLHIGNLSGLKVGDRIKIVAVDPDGEHTGMWVYRYIYMIELSGELIDGDSVYCLWVGVFSDALN